MLRLSLTLLLSLATALPASAAIATFTDRAAFMAALGTTPSSMIGFDGVAAGTVIPNSHLFDGVGFSFSDPTLDLKVLTGFDTTSSPNFLGVDDGSPSGPFLPGDTVNLTFPTPLFALGASFITPAGTPGGVFHVDTPVGSAISGATPSATFASGDEVWFVGLISDAGFGTISLTSDAGGFFSYNLDNITHTVVPEPTAIALVLPAIVAILRRRTE